MELECGVRSEERAGEAGLFMRSGSPCLARCLADAKTRRTRRVVTVFCATRPTISFFGRQGVVHFLS